MPRHRERGAGHELDALLSDLPPLATCRHCCMCGCHFGRLKHTVACTNCTPCGKGHAGVARVYLQEHHRACHPDR